MQPLYWKAKSPNQRKPVPQVLWILPSSLSMLSDFLSQWWGDMARNFGKEPPRKVTVSELRRKLNGPFHQLINHYAQDNYSLSNLPLVMANGAHGRQVAGPEVKTGSEVEGMGIRLSNWQPFPLLPSTRGQACWNSCQLPRVLRWAKMTQFGPLPHFRCKATQVAVAADLLCSGKPAWCRIILVHSYCHEPDALWELGHKPLICWALRAAESNLCPAPTCPHTSWSQLRKKSLAWGGHLVLLCRQHELLQHFEKLRRENHCFIMKLSKTLGAPRPQVPWYHNPTVML